MGCTHANATSVILKSIIVKHLHLHHETIIHMQLILDILQHMVDFSALKFDSDFLALS